MDKPANWATNGRRPPSPKQQRVKWAQGKHIPTPLPASYEMRPYTPSKAMREAMDRAREYAALPSLSGDMQP